MIKIVRESHNSIFPDDIIQCYIISLQNLRIFSTQEIDYLKKSIETLQLGENTLVLEPDYTSDVPPELGPSLDIELKGNLFISRKNESLEFFIGSSYSKANERTFIGQCNYIEWKDAIKKLN
ncbi:hypothetical protein [Leptospira alexanderi]|uniref:hypothetical protein n=1 Tax=Leptospira alexanderi TaxID=100053 RepID=UPI000990F331|nr:hypothetical protein [Leptospira alexanderi]